VCNLKVARHEDFYVKMLRARSYENQICRNCCHRVRAIAAFIPLFARIKVSQAPTKTVLEGVYTEEQAKVASRFTASTARRATDPTLMGGEMAPPLVGGEFASNWNGLECGDLFERMRVSMPQKTIRIPQPPAERDILAFILSSNKYPGGQTEVAKKTEVLKQIKVVPAKHRRQAAGSRRQSAVSSRG